MGVETAIDDGPEPQTREQHDRENAAWWFRRLATTLAIANAAGVLALGSVIGDGVKIEDAAPLIFAPMGQFLTGCICAFVLFVIQTAFVLGRVQHRVDKEEGENAAKRSRGETLHRLTWPLTFYVAYMVSFAVVAICSAWAFLGGADMILVGLRERSCAASATRIDNPRIWVLYPIPDCPERPQAGAGGTAASVDSAQL